MADDGEDLLVLHEVLEGGLTLDGVKLVVGVEELDGAAVNAAGGVDHVQIGLNTGVEGHAYGGVGAGGGRRSWRS